MYVCGYACTRERAHKNARTHRAVGVMVLLATTASLPIRFALSRAAGAVFGVGGVVTPARFFNPATPMAEEAAQVEWVVDGEAEDELEAAQRDYCEYRAENDPARGMLTRLYGGDRAERLIRDFLFHTDDRLAGDL